MRLKQKTAERFPFSGLSLLSVFCRIRPLRPLQWAVEAAGGGAAVNKEGGAADEGALIAQQKLRDVRRLIRRAGAACGAPGEHVLINIPAQADELAQRQRRDDDAGCNGVEPLGSNTQLSSPSESSFPVS